MQIDRKSMEKTQHNVIASAHFDVVFRRSFVCVDVVFCFWIENSNSSKKHKQVFKITCFFELVVSIFGKVSFVNFILMSF